MISLERELGRIGPFRESPDPLKRGLDRLLNQLERLRLQGQLQLPATFYLPELPIEVAAQIARKRAQPIGVIYDFILDHVMARRPRVIAFKQAATCKQCGHIVERRRKGPVPAFCYPPAPCRTNYQRARQQPRRRRSVLSREAMPPLHCEHCHSVITRRRGHPPRFCYAPALCRALAKRGIDAV